MSRSPPRGRQLLLVVWMVSGKQAAREIFLRLVSVDEMGVVTRRRSRQSELVSLTVDPGGLETVLAAFSRFRLLTFDRDPVTRGPTVEVAHEALLAEWPRLSDWIEGARESLMMARRVRESTKEWLDSTEDPSYLLRGSRLHDVEEWASQSTVVLTGDETRYISASSAQREADVRATRRRRRRTIAALAAGLVLVSALGAIAYLQRGVARREALQARVRELAAASRGQLDENRELALLIAAEAFDLAVDAGIEPNSEAASALAQAISDWRLVSRFPAGPLATPTASPNGSLLAIASATSEADVNIFDAEGPLVGTLRGPDDPSVEAWETMFSPDGDSVVVLYAATVEYAFRPVPDGEPDLQIFDLATMSSVVSVDTEHGWYYGSYSPNGETLALTFDNEIRILSSEDGHEISRFEARGYLGRPMFLSDDELMVPIEGMGFTTLSLTDGSIVDRIEAPRVNADITAINDARTHLAYRDGDYVRVVELATGESIYEQTGPSVLSLALDPDASRLAYSGFDPAIHVEPLVEGEEGLQLNGTFENVLAVNFVGEDGLLSYGEDILLWNVSPGGVPQLGGIPIRERQWGYSLSPDERWLAYNVSTNNGGLGDPVDGLRLVDLVTGDETVVSRGEWNSVDAGYRAVSWDFTMVGSFTLEGVSTLRTLPDWDVVRELDECRAPLAISPDNNYVVLSGWSCWGDREPSGSALGGVVDVRSGEEIFSLPYRMLWSAQFNPEGFFTGGRLLAATDRISVGIWDTTTGEMLTSLDGYDHTGFESDIMILSFDPTGRYLIGGTVSGMIWVADMEKVAAGESLVDSLVFRRQAHTGAAPVPALNARGVVATAGFDGMVRLWELDSGDLILEFESDVGIPVVDFSSDGSQLLYPDGLSIRRMPVDPYRLRELADELLTRDFLPDECARYGRPELCEALSG